MKGGVNMDDEDHIPIYKKLWFWYLVIGTIAIATDILFYFFL